MIDAAVMIQGTSKHTADGTENECSHINGQGVNPDGEFDYGARDFPIPGAGGLTGRMPVPRYFTLGASMVWPP